MLVGFIGAVHIEAQPPHRIQLRQRDAQGLQMAGRFLGTGHGGLQPPLYGGQRLDEKGGGGAGADAQHLAVLQTGLHIVESRLGGGLFLFILCHISLAKV